MSKNNPLVSIIIPTYNEEGYIRLCLKSILDQTYPNLEVIVVDDGSLDKSIQVIKEFSVNLLAEQHLGPAKARNKGVGIAKGQILVFIDADMTFSRQFIEDLVRPIIKSQYKGTFSKEEYVSNWDNTWSRCWNINNNWQSKRRIPSDFSDEGNDFRAILKDEFDRVGGFDDTGYTDTWSLAEKLGYKPHSVSGAVYYHANPDNLKEVFTQAKWVAKRRYKFGFIGAFITLVKSSLPFSLFIGTVKVFEYKEPKFIIFKIVFDISYFLGLLEMVFLGKLSK